MQLLGIKECDIHGKKVFIRCDFNVPMDDYGNITDDRRIRSALSTIHYCLDQECAIVLGSHFGRPKGEPDEKYSLAPIARRLHQLLKIEIQMAEDVIGESAKKMASNLKKGEVMLLENLRFEKGETKNDPELSAALASMVEVYINDAFGVSHRAHASVEGITAHSDTEHKAAGFLLQKEIQFFGTLLDRPVRPFAAIVGGSKVSGKL
ncbi:phosphoglycerate kinase, partial [Sulfuricurvum sp.]|uniref:phosphoglycerate kinase n=1 Tax=Sulfuricurvum sp. TaxID=2025608 RepID=UPI00262D2681